MKKENITIRINDKISISSIWHTPDCYSKILIIAHGAGQGMLSSFISQLHEGIAEKGILTIKFNFPYIERGRKAPDRAPLLEATWEAVIHLVLEKTQSRHEQLYISGKSMGGRYATRVAANTELAIGGVIVYGYPLHAPGKTDRLKNEHFPQITCPLLVFQGTRDTLGKIELLQSSLLKVPEPATLTIINGGDHSFKLLKKLNKSPESVMAELTEKTSEWIQQH